MANSKEHLLAGILFGIVIFFIWKEISNLNFEFNDFIKAVFLSVVGAMAPDILEPANSPHHRSIFHSFVALIVTGALVYNMLRNANGINEPILGFIATGYVSHLVLDAATPASLPFIS